MHCNEWGNKFTAPIPFIRNFLFLSYIVRQVETIRKIVIKLYARRISIMWLVPLHGRKLWVLFVPLEWIFVVVDIWSVSKLLSFGKMRGFFCLLESPIWPVLGCLKKDCICRRFEAFWLGLYVSGMVVSCRRLNEIKLQCVWRTSSHEGIIR